MSRPAKRPTPISKVAEICERLIEGESMLSICRDPNMPSYNATYTELENNKEFRTKIARAREIQQDTEIERTIEMADASTPETCNAVKLRIWARQWRASKLAPKKYGDRINVDGIEPANVNIVVNSQTLPALQAGYKELREALFNGRE